MHSSVSLRRHATNRPNANWSAHCEYYYVYVFHFVSQITTDFPLNVIYWQKRTTKTQRTRTAQGNGINSERIEWRRLHLLEEEKSHVFSSLFFFVHLICSTVNWAHTFAVNLYRCSAFTRRDQVKRKIHDEHSLQFLFWAPNGTTNAIFIRIERSNVHSSYTWIPCDVFYSH